MENQHALNNTFHAPTYMKVLAFIFPLFVMYGPVNNEIDNPANRELWGYMLAGLILEVLVLLILAYLW